DYHPGHFHLRIHINDDRGNYDVIDDATTTLANARLRDLTFRYESLKADLRDQDIPDTSAALNLMGLLAFRLDKIQTAVEHFKAVLDEAPDNVNSLQNMTTVCLKLNETTEANEWSTKVRQHLGKSDNLPPSDSSINHKMACSLAEHAYAHAYDVNLMARDERIEQLQVSIRIYDRAFNIGGSAITIEERRRWSFVMATLFIRLDTLLLQSHSSEKRRLPGFNRLINLLKDVSKSDRLYHKALSWGYLGMHYQLKLPTFLSNTKNNDFYPDFLHKGIVLERQSLFETTPMAIHDCGFTGTEPLDCFSKAIQLADNEAMLLNRLAKLFQIMGKHELAIGTASMSLDVDANHVTNMASYHTRARVNTSLYMRDLSRCKQGSSTMPERSLLENAKDDLDHVISAAPSLRTYMDMGQVCYYMGVDAIKESFIVNEDSINKALIHFSKALECELGDILPELQLLRGKCMKVKGEEANAVECFKLSIQMEREGSKNSQAFRWLLETYILWYCQGGPMKRGVIVNEVDTWVRTALGKFDNRAITSEIRTISHSYTHELLDLCKGTIKDGKAALAR
uniref:Uncharacterized protein n=1 Tax=Ciona savignyi TaxID=51511 RepID=H2Z4S3_CIOSA